MSIIILTFQNDVFPSPDLSETRAFACPSDILSSLSMSNAFSLPSGQYQVSPSFKRSGIYREPGDPGSRQRLTLGRNLLTIPLTASHHYGDREMQFEQPALGLEPKHLPAELPKETTNGNVPQPASDN